LRRRRPLAAVLLLALVAAAPALAAPCQVPENKIPNCGFDANIDGWGALEGSVSHQPNEGSSGLGSLEAVSEEPADVSASYGNCITGLTSGVHGFGADARSTNETTSCVFILFPYDGPNCDLAQLGNQLTVQGSAGFGSFSNIDGTVDLPAGTESADLSFECDSVADFTALLDGFYLGVELTPVALQSFSVE
jgi:hypothetical protein